MDDWRKNDDMAMKLCVKKEWLRAISIQVTDKDNIATNKRKKEVDMATCCVCSTTAGEHLLCPVGDLLCC